LHFEIDLAELVHSAESQTRLPPRFGRRHAMPDVIFRQQLEMQRKFLSEILVHASRVQLRTDA
jgi:hypothetical protein